MTGPAFEPGTPGPHIADLLLPDTGRCFGFRIGGLAAGPDVVVACQGALARRLYQRLLLVPSLNRLKGRLFLVSLEPLDDLRSLDALGGLLGLAGPADHVRTLPAVDLDTLAEHAAAELVHRNYWAILRLCARMGMVQGRGIPERSDTLD